MGELPRHAKCLRGPSSWAFLNEGRETRQATIGLWQSIIFFCALYSQATVTRQILVLNSSHLPTWYQARHCALELRVICRPRSTRSRNSSILKTQLTGKNSLESLFTSVTLLLVIGYCPQRVQALLLLGFDLPQSASQILYQGKRALG